MYSNDKHNNKNRNDRPLVMPEIATSQTLNNIM